MRDLDKLFHVCAAATGKARSPAEKTDSVAKHVLLPQTAHSGCIGDDGGDSC